MLEKATKDKESMETQDSPSRKAKSDSETNKIDNQLNKDVENVIATASAARSKADDLLAFGDENFHEVLGI